MSAGVLVVGAAIRGVYVMAREEYFDAQRDYKAGYQKRSSEDQLQCATDPEMGGVEPYEEYEEYDQHTHQDARPESPQPSLPSTVTPVQSDTHSVVMVPPPGNTFPPPPPRSPRSCSYLNEVTSNRHNQETIVVAEPLNHDDALPSSSASPQPYVDFVTHGPEVEWACQRSDLSKFVIVHPPAHAPEHVENVKGM